MEIKQSFLLLAATDIWQTLLKRKLLLWVQQLREPQQCRFCSFKLPGLCWSSSTKPWRYTNIANTSNSFLSAEKAGLDSQATSAGELCAVCFFSLLLEERFVCWRLLGAGQECNACTDCAVFPVQLPLQTPALGKHPDPAAPALLKLHRSTTEAQMLCFSEKLPFLKGTVMVCWCWKWISVWLLLCNVYKLLGWDETLEVLQGLGNNATAESSVYFVS